MAFGSNVEERDGVDLPNVADINRGTCTIANFGSQISTRNPQGRERLDPDYEDARPLNDQYRFFPTTSVAIDSEPAVYYTRGSERNTPGRNTVVGHVTTVRQQDDEFIPQSAIRTSTVFYNPNANNNDDDNTNRNNQGSTSVSIDGSTTYQRTGQLVLDEINSIRRDPQAYSERYEQTDPQWQILNQNDPAGTLSWDDTLRDITLTYVNNSGP